MGSLIDWLLFVLVGVTFFVVALVHRRARLADLQGCELTREEHDDTRIRLLEYVQRHSYRLGTWVDIATFWNMQGLKRDADRLAVLAPLLEEVVLLVPGHASYIDALANRIGDWFFLSLPNRVQLPELVFRRMCQGESIVIKKMIVSGDWVMGDQDKSMNFGLRAGRDTIVGDRIGRDKAGRDAHGVTAGGSVADSANLASVHEGSVRISTPTELAAALMRLAERAEAREETEAVIAALRWAAAIAASDARPLPEDQARHQRTLDRANDWLRAGLSSVVEGATGAVVGHWLLGILAG